MHTENNRLLVYHAEPVQRHDGHYISRALHLIDVGFLQAVKVKMVIVEVEAVVKTETCVQHCRCDNRASVVTTILQHRSQRGLIRTQLVANEVMHSAERRISPSKKSRVRGKRNRHRSVRAPKTNSVASQAIDV